MPLLPESGDDTRQRPSFRPRMSAGRSKDGSCQFLIPIQISLYLLTDVVDDPVMKPIISTLRITALVQDVHLTHHRIHNMMDMMDLQLVR